MYHSIHILLYLANLRNTTFPFFHFFDKLREKRCQTHDAAAKLLK
jgi:hypothetical protein